MSRVHKNTNVDSEWRERQTWSRLERLLGSWLSPWYCPLSRSPAAIFLNFFRSTTYSALQTMVTRESCRKACLQIVDVKCCWNLIATLELSDQPLPDVVFASSEVARPVSGLPEAVSVHLPAALAEWSVSVRSSLQVEVTQLLQVCAHDLKQRRRCEQLSWHKTVKIKSREHISHKKRSLGTHVEQNWVCTSKLFYKTTSKPFSTSWQSWRILYLTGSLKLTVSSFTE